MSEPENPYDSLSRIFHEPKRLAIVSALSGVSDGLTFGDLKTMCELTDGNLSRHLKALEDYGAVSIDKVFVSGKPRTTVSLSEQGRKDFLTYLVALEDVLKKAAEAIGAEGPVKPEMIFGFKNLADA